MPVDRYCQDSRITPERDCVHCARATHQCRVRKRWCPAADLPCCCADYLGRDGETGRQRWPNIDRPQRKAA